MILAPLGATLLDELRIDTKQLGLLVSAYAFSAGASGFATAGFTDRFDRKKILLFFYAGFLVGTALCGTRVNPMRSKNCAARSSMVVANTATSPRRSASVSNASTSRSPSPSPLKRVIV